MLGTGLIVFLTTYSSWTNWAHNQQPSDRPKIIDIPTNPYLLVIDRFPENFDGTLSGNVNFFS
jgi:hypothetical protein